VSGGFFGGVHAALRQEVREFAEREVAPRLDELETAGTFEVDLVRAAARRGWIAVTVPGWYGGMGLGHLAKTVILEELSRVSGAIGAAVQASQLGVAKVVHFGSERQRAYWLPRFASGESLPTIAVTEPESGGHVLAMRSTAVRDGDDYILNGTKCFVGNSHIGDVHGVVVRTGPGSRGLTAFLVESDRPGLRTGDPGRQTGLQGFSYGELVFENCRVPATNRIGVEGEGLDVAYSSSVLYGRPNLTAVALGIHQAIVDDTAAFCRSRQMYGRTLADLPTVALRLGEMASHLTTARVAAYHAVHLLDLGEPCDLELVNAKLVNTESAVTSARTAIGIFGARGGQAEYRVDRYLRDALHTLPPAGTSDIQRHRLSQMVLGSYPQPWSVRLRDRIVPGSPQAAA
jgi:alkylation response protein AidB-like acyl-CoA dehydrogenase